MTVKEALERKKCWTCQHCARVAIPDCLHKERKNDECPGWDAMGSSEEEQEQ